MVVRHSQVDKAFVYQPYERSDLRFSQYGAWAKGTISITVYGHSAMVYCDHLTYPTSSNATKNKPSEAHSPIAVKQATTSNKLPPSKVATLVRKRTCPSSKAASSMPPV